MSNSEDEEEEEYKKFQILLGKIFKFQLNTNPNRFLLNSLVKLTFGCSINVRKVFIVVVVVVWMVNERFSYPLQRKITIYHQNV